jgi:hypothetical protein
MKKVAEKFFDLNHLQKREHLADYWLAWRETLAGGR